MTYNWVYVIREDRKYNLKEENVIIEVYFGCIVKKEKLMNSEPIDVKLYVQTYPYETPINLVGKEANDRNCRRPGFRCSRFIMQMKVLFILKE